MGWPILENFGWITLPETNKSHLKIGFPKRTLINIFQPSILRGELLVFREGKTSLYMLTYHVSVSEPSTGSLVSQKAFTPNFMVKKINTEYKKIKGYISSP